MKKLLLGAVALCLSIGVVAQELPQPSPAASVSQRIGLTDFKVEYSRPAVRGRSVFGDLVPFNQVWRTGANAAVQFNASTDFTFGGKAVKAGNYALFTIPNENTLGMVKSA